MEPKQLIRAAIAASVVGHLVLTLGFILADARPFEQVASQAITVDIVAPEDVPTPAKESVPEPPQQSPKQPDPFRLPEMKFTEQKQQAKSQPPAQQSSQQAPQPPASQQQSSQQQANQQQSSQQPSGQQQTGQQQSSQQASAQSSSQQQPTAKRAAAQQPPSPQPQQSQSAPGTPEPDITVKYGVMLGLPNGDGGTTAFAKADIAPVDTAAFRRHLKSCSALPGSVASTDKVRIVLRAFLEPNGRLIGPPSLIEASASAKGPALMQAAIKALQDCQPYAMLPADKYDEWKVLDLSFTPQDF